MKTQRDIKLPRRRHRRQRIQQHARIAGSRGPRDRRFGQLPPQRLPARRRAHVEALDLAHARLRPWAQGHATRRGSRTVAREQDHAPWWRVLAGQLRQFRGHILKGKIDAEAVDIFREQLAHAPDVLRQAGGRDGDGRGGGHARSLAGKLPTR